MGKDNNQQEIEWLRTQPERLLAHYQYIIEATAAKFIARGFFVAEEKDDLIQQVNLELLEKRLEKIREHFNGSVYLRTYFSKVVYNLCLEEIRRRQRQPRLLGPELLEREANPELGAYERLAILDELMRLEGALKGLPGNRFKGALCLKVLVRIILTQRDVQFYDSPQTREEVSRIREHFFTAYDELTDKEVFFILVALFNKVEGRDTDGDSLRRWVHQLIDHLINLLSGEPAVSNHNRESIKILLRMYFERNGQPASSVL